MIIHRIAAVAITAAVALGLSACSGGSDSGSGSGSGKSELATKMYTWVSNESDREQWETFVKGAQEKDPNFKLEFEGPAFADYWTKVKTRMNSADAPCIITTQAARAQELGSLLSPLDELAKEAGVDLAKYNPAMMEGLTVDGTVRAIPYDAEPMVLYYNKDMFKAAGLKEPGPDYTTEQFLSDTKTLTSGDVMGLAVAPQFSYPYLAFAFANGHTPTADGKLTLTDPGLVEDIQWGFDLVTKEKVATAPSSADITDVAMQNFMNGKAAMVVEGPWFYSTIKDGTKAEVGAAVIPSKDGKPIGMIQGSGFGIAAKCPDKKAAFETIMKITTPEVIAYVGKHRGTVPSLEESMSGWAEGKPEADVKAIEAMVKNGKPLVTTTDWNKVESQFAQYSPEGLRGERSAEDILKSIEQGIG